MALIMCPECRSSVSDQSKTCVNCGAPLMKKDSRELAPIYPFVVLLVNLILPIISLVTFGILWSIIGLIISIIFMIISAKHRNGNIYKRSGFCKAGMIIGIIEIVFNAIVMLIDIIFIASIASTVTSFSY